MFYMLLLILIFFVAVIYYMPVKLVLKTIRKDNDDILIVRITSIFGLLKLKYEVPYMDLIIRNNRIGVLYKAELKKSHKGIIFSKMKDTITNVTIKQMYWMYKKNGRRIKNSLSYMMSKIKVYDFSVILKIGTGDAAATALLYGLAWLVLGCALSVIYNNIQLTAKDIVISPVFEGKAFNVEIGCIITLKLGHIINTGIKLLPVLLHKASSKSIML